MLWHGKLQVICFDNGLECICATRQNCRTAQSIGLACSQPGKLQQHAYVERFNRTVRYEWLPQHHCDQLGEVEDGATLWMRLYHPEQPNIALAMDHP